MSEVSDNDVLLLLEGGEGEYEEKKSRFIATIRPVSSEEEATSFIAEMKKKYWDARHNCSAFIIGNRGELTRCSDDGEPSGTAGRPMLEVLNGSGIKNIAVVVTRYFGGTLLGTGGLVRAYTQAVKAGLENCVTGILSEGQLLEVIADYSDVDKILYALKQKSITPEKTDYAADVTMILKIRVELVEDIEKELTTVTAARCLITRGDKSDILVRI